MESWRRDLLEFTKLRWLHRNSDCCGILDERSHRAAEVSWRTAMIVFTHSKCSLGTKRPLILPHIYPLILLVLAIVPLRSLVLCWWNLCSSTGNVSVMQSLAVNSEILTHINSADIPINSSRNFYYSHGNWRLSMGKLKHNSMDFFFYWVVKLDSEHSKSLPL